MGFPFEECWAVTALCKLLFRKWKVGASENFRHFLPLESASRRKTNDSKKLSDQSSFDGYRKDIAENKTALTGYMIRADSV